MSWLITILYNDLTSKLLLVGLILLQGVTGPTLLVLGYLSNNKKKKLYARFSVGNIMTVVSVFRN